MENFEQESTNTVASAIDFLSLYSDLQHDYKGSNIPNIIAQLLQMYKPNDGITAYEHMLRKVQDLLGDCDLQKKQLLLSMIPAPNNVLDLTIKKVFHTITGFTKLDLQENTFDINGIMDNVSSSKQSFLYDKNASNFKSFSETFPFRGFSESEISTIQSNVINVDSINHQLDNNQRNCPDRDNKYQLSSYQQYLLNKKHCVPKINTTNETHLCYPSQVYQNPCSMKVCNNTEIIADLCQDKNLRFNDVKYEYKKCQDTNTFIKNKKSGSSHMIIDIDQNTMKQTIKDNIHKMDVCWDEDQNIVVDADDLLAAARDKLKTSLNNFLKRAQEGISIELPVFPRTRSYPQVGSLNLAYLTSKDQKPGMSHQVLGQDFIFNVSSSDNNSCLLSKQQNTDANLEKNQRESDERTEPKAITCVNELKTQCSSQGSKKATDLRLQQNNLDYIMEKKAVKLEYKENETNESIFGRKLGSNSNDINSEDNFQAHSMSQLAAYKKQYYDTLLSVQRAKAAVTNSLASSSDHLTGYDDPYYSNYICQQQHLFRQQHHFTTRPQLSTYPADLSGLSNVHSNQYSWARSVCKYLLLKQLRLQRQTLPLYARNQDGWIHRYIGPTYPYSFMSNESSQTKHCIRRKSLEDIIGKLKRIERSNINNMSNN